MTIQVIGFDECSAPLEERRLADLPDRVVEGDPQHRSRSYFKSESGDMVAGTWTSTPGKWHAFVDRDEFCYIVSGHVRLISADGNVQTFRTGDAFVIPNGFRGFWEVVCTTTKHFVVRSYDRQ